MPPDREPSARGEKRPTEVGGDRAAAIFLEAADLPPEDREAFLQKACGRDAALLEEVRSLLLHDRQASPLDALRFDSLPPRSEAPTSIGPYRILRVLGEGGMGAVYLAEQQQPIRRRVALKIIKPGMDTREVLARFESERQALAMMSHPNIAKVLDAGATEEGRPYFVMEPVTGMSLTSYCDKNRLPNRQRLQLFITACEAIHHAHQRGIIHRDVKPSNLLVSEEDGSPALTVIDFGVAKAIGHRLTETTLCTQHGMLIGTPEYMSPEQTEPNLRTVDARTDVYSLGVVLYELLVGTLPLEPSRLQGVGYDELRRIIREEHPPTPSSRTRTPGANAGEAARRRRTKPSILQRTLEGDLDWITMKALEKEPGRRYATAADLAADLRRFLADQPVLARPPSLAYTIARFHRRHRRALFTAVAIVLALAAGMVMRSLLPGASPVAVVADAERPIVAVLPFENLGPPEDYYLAAGISEEIIARLTSVEGLGVTAPSSAAQYAGSDMTTRRIGEELGADYLLRGRLRWAGDRGATRNVRITSTLVRTVDETHVWAQTYDRPTADLFHVQSDIAREVTRQLSRALVEPVDLGPQPSTANPEAYNAYLRGLYHKRKRTTHGSFGISPIREDLRRAADAFQRAVDLDGSFVRALAELSMAHTGLIYHGVPMEGSAETARRAAEQALGLDPDAAEAHLALGYYYYHVRAEHDRALEEFTIAEQGMPDNAEMLAAWSSLLRDMNRLDESVDYLARAAELDPRNPGLAWGLALDHALLRDYAEAMAQVERARALAPESWRMTLMKVPVYWLWRGTTAEAREVLESLPAEARDAPPVTLLWIDQHVLEGDYRGALDQLAVHPPDALETLPLLKSARIHALLSEHDLARRAYTAARERLEVQVRSSPEDALLHARLGEAYAGLGLQEEAIREGRRGANPNDPEFLARIHLMLGQEEAALDELERLLATPCMASVPLLRLDPTWIPLRDHPRFRSLGDS